MIVSNMNLHEVYAHLLNEKSKLDWKRDALMQKATNELRKRRTFPAFSIYDYKIPSSNNQYIIYFYLENPFTEVMSGYLFVIFDENKRYIIKWSDAGIPEIHILTSHFLQRYKERFLGMDEWTANEVAVAYLSRNFRMRPIAIDSRINQHIQEYGEYAGEGFLVHDGFCFKLSGEETLDGEDPIRVSFYTTFMPLSEMSYVQRRAIYEECMKDVEEMRY